MSERARMLGERAELRQEYNRQMASCGALRTKMRELLSPVEDVFKLDRDALLDTMMVLHSELGELKVMAKKLSLYNRELGDSRD